MLKEAVKRKKESFKAWFVQGIPGSADKYQEVRKTAASVVMETKRWVWEEFEETMEKNFGSASRRFWKTFR